MTYINEEINMSHEISNTDKYFFTYDLVSQKLIDAITAIEDEEQHYKNILLMIHVEKEILQINVLDKIKQYGEITDTDVEDIDDMKVMFFLSQAIIAKNLYSIPPRYLKAISKIAYMYIREQAYSVNPLETNSVILDKIDHIYENENISIPLIWNLFGKYGIYATVKSVYYMYYGTKYPENIESESYEENLREQNTAYQSLNSTVEMMKTRELDLTPWHRERLKEFISIILDKKCELNDSMVDCGTEEIDLENLQDIVDFLSKNKKG